MRESVKTFSMRSSGFTLIELLVTMAITGIVCVAMFGVYKTTNRTYAVQNEVVEAQNNLRAAVSLPTRELRMAGYNPGVTDVDTDGVDNDGDGSTDEGDGTENFGFHAVSGASLTSTAFRITMDLNEDDDFCDANEDISYTLADGDSDGDSDLLRSGDIVAENIENIEFQYVNESSAATTTPANVRGVTISILAKTVHEDSGFSDNKTYTTGAGSSWSCPTGYHCSFSTVFVKCRNMGL